MSRAFTFGAFVVLVAGGIYCYDRMADQDAVIARQGQAIASLSRELDDAHHPRSAATASEAAAPEAAAPPTAKGKVAAIKRLLKMHREALDVAAQNLQTAKNFGAGAAVTPEDGPQLARQKARVAALEKQLKELQAKQAALAGDERSAAELDQRETRDMYATVNAQLTAEEDNLKTLRAQAENQPRGRPGTAEREAYNRLQADIGASTAQAQRLRGQLAAMSAAWQTGQGGGLAAKAPNAKRLAGKIAAVQGELNDANAELQATRDRVQDQTKQINDDKADFAKLQEAYDAELTNVKALEAELHAAD